MEKEKKNNENIPNNSIILPANVYGEMRKAASNGDVITMERLLPSYQEFLKNGKSEYKIIEYPFDNLYIRALENNQPEVMKFLRDKHLVTEEFSVEIEDLVKSDREFQTKNKIKI